jgi:serine protease Do
MIFFAHLEPLSEKTIIFTRMLKFMTRFLKPVLLVLVASIALESVSAQNRSRRVPTLSEDQFKSGFAILRAFAPISESVRDSIAILKLDGKSVALGTIVDADGFIITKASEIGEGKLTCALANLTEVDARVVARDDENDVALVKIEANNLQPISWAHEPSLVGQWAVTPGIDMVPEAVGLVSVPPRKILHRRAYIGVVLANASSARIDSIIEGLGAEKAGLKPGDQILSLNNTPVASREELIEKLKLFREGQIVQLRVQREQDEFDSNVIMMVQQEESTPRRQRFTGEVSQRAEGFESAIQHDTVLQPWQCGGPLVNLEGKAIGLNIARAGRIASYALPADLVQQIIANLTAETLIEVRHDNSQISERLPE